jgi:hypothetical protein
MLFLLISDFPKVTHFLVLTIKQTPEVGSFANGTKPKDTG